MSPELKEKMRLGREKKLAEKREKKQLEKAASELSKDLDVEKEFEEVTPIDKKLDLLISAVSKLVELLKTADKQSGIVRTSTPVSPLEAAVQTGFTPHIEDETYPGGYVPPAYRRIVNEVLSEEFKLRVSDFQDRTEFQLDIIVPDRFSSVSKADREKGVEDIRSRIIPRALGENGVRDWCKLIRGNLNRYYTSSGKASPFKEAAE